jgi:DNA binding domain, excisionase family
MATERLYTTGEIARLLHVSRQSVTRWIREGRLEAIAINVSSRPTYRVSESRFRAFVRRYVQGLE